MTNKTKGHILFIAGLGMMLTLTSVELSNLTEWTEALRPSFVGTVAAHIGSVISAYVGGKLIPNGA